MGQQQDQCRDCLSALWVGEETDRCHECQRVHEAKIEAVRKCRKILSESDLEESENRIDAYLRELESEGWDGR